MSRTTRIRGPRLTPEIIAAATLDAGNASARAHGRTIWNAEDADAAAAVSARLWDVHDARERPAVVAALTAPYCPDCDPHGDHGDECDECDG